MTAIPHYAQTSELGVSGILFFYLVSYYILLFILAVYFSSSSRLPNIKYTREVTAISTSLLARAVVLGCILALTGLPPMPFFLPKLAVVGVIINSKPITVALASLLLVFTGWFLYGKLATLLLSGNRALPLASTTRSPSVSTVAACAMVLAGVFLLGGVFLSSPLIVWCHWIALPVILCCRIFLFLQRCC